jgi:hypothetical protein
MLHYFLMGSVAGATGSIYILLDDELEQRRHAKKAGSDSTRDVARASPRLRA